MKLGSKSSLKEDHPGISEDEAQAKVHIRRNSGISNKHKTIHNAQFDVSTGKPLNGVTGKSLRTFTLLRSSRIIME